jgi:probable HAF family extracellular repeat protein
MRRYWIRAIGLLPVLVLPAFLLCRRHTPTYTLTDLGVIAGNAALTAGKPAAPTLPNAPPTPSTAPSRRPNSPLNPPTEPLFHSPRYTNAAGQAAWTERRGHGAHIRYHAYFSQNGHTIDLGTLGGSDSSVEGLSDSGHIIGISQTVTGDRHAFLWRDGAMLDLGTLPGGNTCYPKALNAKDQVVGAAQTDQGDFHAFLWSNGVLTDLGLLPHGTDSYAYALNNRTEIVGSAVTESGATHAVVWRNGQIRDLNRLIPARYDLVLVWATGIDARGQIEAIGRKQDIYHRFLLTPIH